MRSDAMNLKTMRAASAKYFSNCLLGLWIVVFASTSGCLLTRPNVDQAPIVFDTPPDRDAIIDAVNANNDRVQQLHSSSVRLTTPRSVGSLRATVDFDRMTGAGSPGRFRMSGSALGSRQIDLGSNDEAYWMWVKQNQPPTVFWGRHQDFYQSAAQQFLPMPPSWLIDALGVVHLDPQGNHEGPYASQTPGLLQLRTRIPTPHGELLRVLEIDQRRALIVQQQIFDERGNLLAIATGSNFRQHLTSRASLPHKVQVNLPAAGLSFDFQVDSYVLNQPITDSSHWEIPEIPQHRYLDLANPHDMRGITLLGMSSPDFYQRDQVAPRPVEAPRAAWRSFPPFNVFR